MQNIIADFTNKKCDTLRLKGLTQWDYGRVLEVRLENMPETFEAHFSYQGFDDALVVEVTSENNVAMIPIPNLITTQNKEATCWIYYEAETCGATYKTIILLITPRTKPHDYVYTETEVFNYKIFKKEIESKIADAGKVKTVNGTEPDENGNIEVDTVSSWNDLKSKPFYEEVKKEMIIDSYEHVLTGETRFDDYDKEYVNYPNFEIDGTAFNETWTTGEELYLLCNGVEYKGVVEINKGGEMIYFDSAELSPIILPNERNPNLFTIYPVSSSDLTKLEVPITFSLYRKSTEVKQLDEKYLPRHTHSWNDVGVEITYLVEPTVYTGENSRIPLLTGIVAGETYILSIDDKEYMSTAIYQGNPVYANMCLFDEVYSLIDGTSNSLHINGSDAPIGATVSVKHVSYLPINAQRISEEIPRIYEAEVGQTIVVKEVDKEGKPSAWECVDMPASPMVLRTTLTGEIDSDGYSTGEITADEEYNFEDVRNAIINGNSVLLIVHDIRVDTYAQQEMDNHIIYHIAEVTSHMAKFQLLQANGKWNMCISLYSDNTWEFEQSGYLG